MRLILALLLALALTGCKTTDSAKANMLSESGYPFATKETKRQLAKHLKYGKLKLGTTAEHIMTTYGEPDKISNYKKLGKDIQYSIDYKTFFLYFQDGVHLSSWNEW